MFGADTPLVMDAIQIGIMASAFGGAAIFLIMRRSKTSIKPQERAPADLEDRVRVLERIATDSAIGDPSDLAEEIETLREPSLQGRSR